MASTPDPQPYHHSVSHLDDAFTNAAPLAGILEYLKHPEEHDGPYLLKYGDGTSSERTGGARPERTGTPANQTGATVASVMRDLAVEDFFYEADVLSGQKLGRPENAAKLGFNVLEEARHLPPNDSNSAIGTKSMVVIEDLKETLIMLFGSVEGGSDASWTGIDADAAWAHVDKMTSWFPLRDAAMLDMQEHLVQFAAIIHGARENLNELMGNLVGKLNEWMSSGVSGGEFLLWAIKLVASRKLPESTVDAALEFLNIFEEIMGKLREEDGPVAAEGSCYGILRAYREAAAEVMVKTDTAVSELVKKVQVVRGNIDDEYVSADGEKTGQNYVPRAPG